MKHVVWGAVCSATLWALTRTLSLFPLYAAIYTHGETLTPALSAHSLTHTPFTKGGCLHGYKSGPWLNFRWNNARYLTNIVFFLKKDGPRAIRVGNAPPVSPSGTQRPAETSSLRGQTWPLVDLAVLGLSYSYWEQTLLIDFVHWRSSKGMCCPQYIHASDCVHSGRFFTFLCNL